MIFVPICGTGLRANVFALYVNIWMAWKAHIYIYIYIWVYIFFESQMCCTCVFCVDDVDSIYMLWQDIWDVYVCVAWCDICQYNTMLAISSVVWFNSLGICVNVMESKCRDNNLTCRYLRKRHGSRTRYTLLSWRMTSWESRKMLRWQIWWRWASTKRPMTVVYSAWLLVASPKNMPLECSISCEGVYRAQAAEARFCVQRLAPSA